MSERKKEQDGLKPICFMVMPFQTKCVTARTGSEAPGKVDFDALWDRALAPAIEELGYIPRRADQDPGGLIIRDMLERLAYADLVLADVSIPSGNCYYEVGIRHVAKETRCVLIAADWSLRLFDIAQFNTLQYPLLDGTVPEEEANTVRDHLVRHIPPLIETRTPWHETISGPEQEARRRGVFREASRRLSAFQSRVRSIRLSDQKVRWEMIQDLRADLPASALEIPEVAVELLTLIRDLSDSWDETLAFIDTLPPRTLELPFIQEQRLLALGNTGKPEEAVARLEELIEWSGETPERRGLLGGRYKRLWRAARDERIARGDPDPSSRETTFLEEAISHYQAGMELDYNQYYCACNLPALLRARGEKDDTNRAVIVDHFVVAACERALRRKEDDAWTRQTLLGAAFRAGDMVKAEELATRVKREGAARWQLQSTLADLADVVADAGETETGGRLGLVLAELERLAGEDRE